MIASTALPRMLPFARWQRREIVWRDALIVLAAAFILRLLFALLVADTYDPDEFVVLALSRDLAGGAVPYHDFMFFHPPGALVLFRALQPLTGLWWPSARLFILLVDCASAVLVWRIGCRLFDRRTALLAGLLYAASPIPLLASVRVGQDSVITALGLLGLLLLLSRRSTWGALGAGVCLGAAFWFKYPALLFLPVYALAVPRRFPIVLAGALLAILALFAPFASHLPALFHQSIGWQAFGRGRQDLIRRIGAVGSFMVLLNPLAAPALLRGLRVDGMGRKRPEGSLPLWIPAGFALGACFLLSAQVYYHYFVPIVAFAALLSAPLLSRLLRLMPRLVVAGGTVLLGLWTAALNVGMTRDGLGEMSLASIRPAVHLVERATGRNQPVLTDQFEYAYLAHRPSASVYFWDMETITSARTLERSLTAGDAVVATSEGSSYPAGFVTYLERRHYPEVHTPVATVWLVPGHARTKPSPLIVRGHHPPTVLAR